MNDRAVVRVPESVSSKGGSFTRWAAKVSPAAPLFALAFNMVCPDPQLRVTKIIIGSIIMLILVTGLILALIALRGVRRYGAKGIRAPAIAGLVINGALVLVSIVGLIILFPALGRVAALQKAGYTRAEMKTMPEVIPGSHKILDETVGFRMEVPGDFVDDPRTLSPEVLYSFVRPDPNERNLVISVARLGGQIWGPMPAEVVEAMRAELPAGSELLRNTVRWRTYELDTFMIRHPVNDLTVCTHFVQVPLNREAIQISVSGPADLQSESYALLALLLRSLQGLTYADAVERVRQQRELSR